MNNTARHPLSPDRGGRPMTERMYPETEVRFRERELCAVSRAPERWIK